MYVVATKNQNQITKIVFVCVCVLVVSSKQEGKKKKNCVCSTTITCFYFCLNMKKSRTNYLPKPSPRNQQPVNHCHMLETSHVKPKNQIENRETCPSVPNPPETGDLYETRRPANCLFRNQTTSSNLLFIIPST